jgi:hypothetical protein
MYPKRLLGKKYAALQNEEGDSALQDLTMIFKLVLKYFEFEIFSSLYLKCKILLVISK